MPKSRKKYHSGFALAPCFALESVSSDVFEWIFMIILRFQSHSKHPHA